ncbi:MAG: hypothetical protein RI560_12690 [Natronomonas sp.]|jgi:hypothetical protein|nr:MULTISPECIES: hypothetical protein [Natronomonas]MDR9382512.1 hypothetical protein [Natronomonas sp.]MDR9430604.1 hypothetical protein [Natronomonas sp.]
MNAADLKSELDHASFRTAGSTVAAYVLILLGMTLVLFGIPYLIFSLF